MQPKMRFEVFKRDGFKCQYCGRSAPEVTLEVDHIVPVAEGGKNEMLNLITSCRACNRGKGKTKLSDDAALVKEKVQLEELNERRIQLEMMLRWKQELSQLENKQIDAIAEIAVPGRELTPSGRKFVKKVLLEFGFNEVYEAAEIAALQYENDEKRINSLGGICYNRRSVRINGHQKNR